MLSLMREQALGAVKDFFRPELLHRIDEIVFFHPLETPHLQQIVDLFILDTGQRLAQQSMALEVTPRARDLLVERGYEPVYGARPLRRAVQRLLEDPLAEAILHNDLTPGDLAVIDAKGEQLVVQTRVPVSSGGQSRGR
jgi:ATP-dependent Clp protease ATP-binding subunit ClpC